ncbi:MAG: ribosome maturation factor RimM, partial [Muribaculaceae bacterium]|nr:ribosome maturation factor RimM [Muribaculaceae bacterium]
MTDRDKLEEIGRFNKAHGIKGEISATIEDIDPEELPCIFVEIEGLFVPFFITSVRTKGPETWLLKIKGIDSETDCSMLVNKTIYVEDGIICDDVETDQDGFYMRDLIGYEVIADGVPVGIIEDFDDSTDNVLFIVKRHDSRNTLYIPAADEMIGGINTDNKTISMDLP